MCGVFVSSFSNINALQASVSLLSFYLPLPSSSNHMLQDPRSLAAVRRPVVRRRPSRSALRGVVSSFALPGCGFAAVRALGISRPPFVGRTCYSDRSRSRVCLREEMFCRALGIRSRTRGDFHSVRMLRVLLACGLRAYGLLVAAGACTRGPAEIALRLLRDARRCGTNVGS